MSVRISRRKIAAYVADELISGHDAVRQLAAYLVDSGRIREAELIVRDVEAALADRGVLVADIASSRDLGSDTKKAITHYLQESTGANDVHLRQEVDADLLGGVSINTPGHRFDTTLRHRLNQLTASKI